MGPRAFIFDLDMTLLDTSALEGWRTAQNWEQVKSNLALAKPFPGKPPAHEIPGLLRAAGHAIGIVTSSPGWYAKALLKAFGIKADVIVAYEDTAAHKPDPEPILKALGALGVSLDRAHYIGDAPDDVIAAYRAKVLSIGAGWNPAVCEHLRRTAPDVMLHDPALLTSHAKNVTALGYVAEVIAAGQNPVPHAGSAISCGTKNYACFALGRYFPRKDARHEKSALSTALLELKNEDARAPLFADALVAAFAGLPPARAYLVTVPPKPSQPRNRFAVLLDHAKPRLSVLMYPDGLKCVKEIEDYKGMGPEERAAAIDGAFKSEYTWNGKGVVVLDDVFTFGGTLGQCARVLAENKADPVMGMCFGIDQEAFEMKICPACGRSMRVRRRRSDNAPFWGCSGYKSGACNYTSNY